MPSREGQVCGAWLPRPHFFNMLVFILVYIFLAVLGLCCCTWAFSSCSQWGLLSSCSQRGLLSSCNTRASHCGGFSHCRAQVLVRRLSSCGPSV